MFVKMAGSINSALWSLEEHSSKEGTDLGIFIHLIMF